jgi:hypothetical protein
MRPFFPTLLCALVVVACSHQQQPTGSVARESQPFTADDRRMRLERLTDGLGATSCRFDDDLALLAEIDTWFDQTSPPESSLGGRDREGWRELAARTTAAEPSAGRAEAFVDFWEARGGSVDEEGYLERGARLARADPSAIEEVRAGPSYHFASAMISALGDARNAGDREAMVRLVDALLQAHPDPRERAGIEAYLHATSNPRDMVAVAAYLHELGRVDEAAAVVATHAGHGARVALGGREGSMYLVRFIDEAGIEEGLSRFSVLFGDRTLDSALHSAPGEYRHRNDADRLNALLRSSALADRIAGSENPLILAPTIVEALAVREDDGRLNMLSAMVDRTAGGDEDPAWILARLLYFLAEAGCGDDCLQVPLARLQALHAEDRADPNTLGTALAATGNLEAALVVTGDPSRLGDAAIAYAVGRRAPDYLDPLLDRLPGAPRTELSSRLAADLYWRRAAPEHVARALARRPRDEEPDMSLNMLAGSAVYDDHRSEDDRHALRRVLVGWREGLCAVQE